MIVRNMMPRNTPLNVEVECSEGRVHVAVPVDDHKLVVEQRVKPLGSVATFREPHGPAVEKRHRDETSTIRDEQEERSNECCR